MINIPEYQQYNGEKCIALMDNSSLAFMDELNKKSFSCDKVLEFYDLILIPGWVMEEVEDSKYRVAYVEKLRAEGYPVYSIDETKYSFLTGFEEINLYYIVSAVISKVPELMRYIRQNVVKNDLLDLDSAEVWIKKFHDEWPILGNKLLTGRVKKKNAGEISLAILAEIFSWYYCSVDTLTIFTQDADAYDFQMNGERKLKGNKNFTAVLKNPLSVGFKSNDFILSYMYRKGLLKIENIKQLRCASRRLIYVKGKTDSSSVYCDEVVSSGKFVGLIDDCSVQILF